MITTLEWVDYYDHRRIHSSIDDMPPAERKALYYTQVSSDTVAKTISS
jgi:putative transposase